MFSTVFVFVIIIVIVIVFVFVIVFFGHWPTGHVSSSLDSKVEKVTDL